MERLGAPRGGTLMRKGGKMEGLKELAEVLQTVSGDARDVLLTWLIFRLVSNLLFLGGFLTVLTLAYKLINRAIQLNDYAHRLLRIVAPQHAGVIEPREATAMERALAEGAEVLAASYQKHVRR